ncbi:MAG TPA: hypothetical protein VHH36_02090 [Candidatus Thermoplasmatota archaeon]|nr:hypothetical protein [Candidatus Thermoplasmatota archaeon]
MLDAPRPSLLAPLADRHAASLAPARAVAVARCPTGGAVALAARAFGRDEPLERAFRHAAGASGAQVRADARSGHALVDAAEEGRFLKALAEALV